jgi:putative NADPH-quinone reductase
MAKSLKILIIDPSPAQKSLVSALLCAYQKNAQGSGAEIRKLNLIELAFDLSFGYKSEKGQLEPAIIKAQKLLGLSEHMFLVYPNWWRTYSALRKGFLDRTHLPGFAFKFLENSPLRDKLLKERSAQLLVTIHMPSWYYTLSWNAASFHEKLYLRICGSLPINFHRIRNATPEKRNLSLKQAEAPGFRWQ